MFWELANGFFHLIYGVILYLVVFRNRFRFSMKTVYTGASVCLIMCMGIPLTLFQLHPHPENWVGIYSIVFIVFLALICVFITEFSFYRILLVFFILGNYMDSITLFKESAGPILSAMWPVLDYQVIAVISRLLGGVISLPFMIYFCNNMIRPIIDGPNTQSYSKYLWITPASFFLMYRLCINPEEHRQFFVFHDVSTLLFWVWTLGTFLLTFSVIKMLQNIIDQGELERRLEVAVLNSNMQMKQYENIVHQMEDVKLIRHDLRHHVLALQNYCDAGEYGELKVYLNGMGESLEVDTQITYCENFLINGVLKHYQQIAKDAKIIYEVSVNLPNKLDIVDEDICVLVSNAIENAVEACKRQQNKERFIRIKSQLFGNAFTMKIENSFEGRIVQKKNGTYISSKRNEDGIGLASIQQICEQYNGICKIHHEHHIFTLSVLLNQGQKAST